MDICRKVYVLALLLTVQSSIVVFGAHAFNNKLNTCLPTKSYINNYEPAVFNTTNNLLRLYDQTKNVHGKEILLIGTVVDQGCNPVPSAKIFMWQKDIYGKYPYQTLRPQANKMIYIDKNSAFIGSGTAISNNVGAFTFITLLPGTTIKNDKAHINLRIEIQNDVALQTKIAIRDMEIIDFDTQQELPVYQFRIVIPQPK